MKSFKFEMPVRLYVGDHCIWEHRDSFKEAGKKAYILTGKHSSKANGSFKDITEALEAVGISYVVFDEIEENPTLETELKADDIGRKAGVDFTIGVGGGSAMDSAKAVAFLIANPEDNGQVLFDREKRRHLPIVEIPTTAGTGSETTQYAIVTLHEKRTKSGTAQKAFPMMSFLDPQYMDQLPAEITNNTAIDALTHLIEGYLCTEASFLSDMLSEFGMQLFVECKEAIRMRSYSREIREKLMLIAAIGGMVIAQSQTSLPHAMGYYLTYFKGVAHGPANAYFTKAYLDLFGENKKVERLLEILGFHDTGVLDCFFKSVLKERPEFTKEEIEYYTDELMKNTAKLITFPKSLSRDQIEKAFIDSLLS